MSHNHSRTLIGYCVAFSLAVIIVSIIVLSLVPPVSRDALTHHLAVPKLYLKHGGIYEIPSMPFSYFPMNLDLLYMISLSFGNDIAPKLIHCCFALLTGWLIFGFLRPRTNIRYAILGVAFFLSTPIIVKLSTTAYVDLGLIFFSTAALLLLLRWVETGFRMRFLVLSAITCGLAMGTKYNGLITFFLLTLFVLFISARANRAIPHGRMRAIANGFVFLTIAVIIFSPWMIRDYVWTGNPIYPLYNQWFNAREQIAPQSIGIFAYRALVYHEKWWQILLLPVRIFFQGQDGNPQFFDGKLNPFILLFPLAAFYHLRKDSEKIKTEKKILLAFSALYFFFAFFSSGLRIRYIAPIIPPLVILAVFGMKRLVVFFDGLRTLPSRNGGKVLAVCLIFFALSLNGQYVYGQFQYVKPFRYLLGSVSRDEYIERYRPEYPAMKYMNDHLPLDAKVLFVFIGNRGYYCDRAYVFDMQGNRSRIAGLLRRRHDAQAVWEGLKRDGITHVLINIRLFNRWSSQSFSSSDLVQVRSFFRRYLQLLYNKNGYAVFVLAGKSPCDR